MERKSSQELIENTESTCRDSKYALYVLILLMTTYLINQIDTFSLIATNKSMAQEIRYGERICIPRNHTFVFAYDNVTSDQYCSANDRECLMGNSSLCHWQYLGQGFQYQLLAGPFYIVLFSISGVPLGLLSELHNVNRRAVLVTCVLLWSFMTLLGGGATRYWHLVVTRLLLGIFSAGCVPFSVSLIADYFSSEKHGAALGVYNWGVYIGYSMTYVLLALERALGWRPVYLIAGAPGVLLAFLILFTVREPPRRMKQQLLVGMSEARSTLSNLRRTIAHFCNASLLLLCIGGAVRNGGGIVWAYNLVIFFDVYHPSTKVELWMTWIPLLFGSLGAVLGGYISDRLSVSYGQRGRLTVLVLCLLLSAPFEAGVLYLAMPWAFLVHIPGLLIGEMWIGVCVAAVVDLIPPHLTATAVAVYFCIIQLLGANAGLLVPPLAERFGRRLALLLTFPGLYVVAAAIFCLTFFTAKPKRTTEYQLSATVENDERKIAGVAA